VKPFIEKMTLDDLWALHAEIQNLLTIRITAEKLELERRLARLKGNGKANDHGVRPARKPYPKVLPKYRNPKKPSETWSGRGKQPRWIRTQLKSGKKLNDFAIREP
jgi:DNA-binding protein H-NS